MSKSNNPDAFILRPQRDIEVMIFKSDPTILEPNTSLLGAYPDGQARRRERRRKKKLHRNPKR